MTVAAVLLTALASSASGQEDDAPQIPKPLLDRATLGQRVANVDAAFPVVDRVVLVPDVQTYLDELGKWSREGRWPVLIEDDHLTPMFVRRFAPAQLVRRESVGRARGDRAALQQQILDTVVSAWGGNPVSESIKETFDRLGYEPPGVVLTSVTDPAWTAAVALAAGRGQPVAWLDGNYGRVAGAMAPERADELAGRVNDLVEKQGWSWAGSGDAIETITICRSLAARARVPHPGSGKVEPAALTDVLGRNADGTRYALVSWIFGDEVRSAYAAMCALFLERSRVWMCNSYGDDGGFGMYGMTDAAAALEAKGFGVVAVDGAGAALPAWHRGMAHGLSADVVMVNTKGAPDVFHLSDGAQASAWDVPLLNEPAIVHFIHSWSMKSPDEAGTVARQWLAHGAYGYVGSVHEPYLSAFVRPSSLVQQWVNGVPFLSSARHWNAPKPMSGPWKVSMYGDPLMLCAPPAIVARPRLAPDEIDDAIDVEAQCRAALERIRTDADATAFADAVRDLVLLRRDQIAIETWRLAMQRDLGEHASYAALDPLFRAGLSDDFVEAFAESTRRTEITSARLWHLFTWQLDRTLDEDTLLLLQSSIRRPHAEVDVGRLLPALTATFGMAHARNVVQRELERTDRPGTIKALRLLLRRSGSAAPVELLDQSLVRLGASGTLRPLRVDDRVSSTHAGGGERFRSERIRRPPAVRSPYAFPAQPRPSPPRPARPSGCHGGRCRGRVARRRRTSA